MYDICVLVHIYTSREREAHIRPPLRIMLSVTVLQSLLDCIFQESVAHCLLHLCDTRSSQGPAARVGNILYLPFDWPAQGGAAPPSP